MEAVTAAWERYAAGRTPRRAVNATGATTWLNWTQYPDHGPDESLLGPIRGRRVLELGCGTGCNLAHLATLGAQCVGIDVAPTQRTKAEARWGHVSGLTFRTVEATQFLSDCAEHFDVVFSIFGAAWFTDPERLIPLVRKRLTQDAVFAFSHKPAAKGQQLGTSLRQARAVSRWDYSADEWADLLASSGFSNVAAEIIAPPDGEQEGTLLVRAEA